jgi:hypothetical protein
VQEKNSKPQRSSTVAAHVLDLIFSKVYIFKVIKDISFRLYLWYDIIKAHHSGIRKEVMKHL